MIKIKFYKFVFIILIFNISSIYAQQGIVSAGGDGSSASGSFSYSIGQIDYTNFSSPSGFVELGIQHPGDIPPPVATSPQNFCTSPSTLVSIAITGSNIKWYTASTGGTLLPNSTPLLNGTTYYATQTIGTLESRLRTAVLVNVSNITFTLASKIDNNCVVGNMGSATVNPATGGIAPYTYNWIPGNPNGDGTTTITGLSAGLYTCIVTDAIGCTKNVAVEILQGNTTINFIGSYQNNVTCFNGNDGSVGMNLPTGGVAPYTYTWSHDALNTSLTASGLTAGSYTCTATDANGCQGSYQFILVNPEAVSGPIANSPQVFCANGLLHQISATGENIKYYDNPTGGSALNPTTALVNSTTYYLTQTINGCESPTRTGVLVTIGSAPNVSAQPTNATITEGQTTAFSVTATNVVSRQWQYSTDGGIIWQDLINSGGTPTVLGATNAAVFLGNVPLSWNGYLFRVLLSNASCSNIASAPAALTVNSICPDATTWNGTSWSNGLPTSNSQVTFTGNYATLGDINACRIYINNNATVTVNPNHTIVSTYDINIANGSNFIIENNGAFRQLNTNSNTGTAIVKRTSAPMIRLDYTSWSSPVSGQQILAFSPYTQTTRFYTYNNLGVNPSSAYIPANTNSNFDPAKGYLIRVANYWSPTVYSPFDGKFTGVLNNGNYDTLLGNGFNMIGNPYPSPISAISFLNNNPSVTSLYFWTHTIPASGGTYPTNNYASYTMLGGVAAAAGGEIPNGYIQTGQGFYTKTSGTNLINFNNNQRVNAALTNQFFRFNEAAKHRIWLNLNSETKKHNQILIGYMDGATNAIDNAIDAQIMDEENSVIYNIINNEKYVIQGKSMPFSPNDVVPLGVKLNTAGTYKINIETKDGLFTNQDVYLKDKYLNTIHDLNNGEYSFTTTDGTFNDRFEIVYQNTTLGNESFDNNTGLVIYQSQPNQIDISSSNEDISSIVIYDLLGKKLYQNEKINARNYNIKQPFETKLLLIQVKLVNNQIKNQKLILN